MVDKVNEAEKKAHEVLVSQYEKAYMEANHVDRKAADANVTSMLQELHTRGIPAANIDKALDHMLADNLPPLQESAANRAANALTPAVDNYAPGDGVTRVTAQSSTQATTGASNLNLDVNHGLDAKEVGLTRLAVHGNVNHGIDSNATSGGAGFTAVKALPESLQPDGTTLFVAGGADAHADAKGVTGDATLLGVAASNVNGMPVGAYAGGAVDFKTGDITKVAHLEGMLNSDTNHPTTLAVGGATKNFDAETSSVNVSIYQQYKDFYAGVAVTTPVNAPQDTAITAQIGGRF